MKKVANCFMSLGSVSRARAIFNGVMSKNSCRVVLIALLMFVCGNGAVFAQLADGDIITISIQITTGDWRPQTTTHYLSANKNNNNVEDFVTGTLTPYILWKVSKVDGNANQYTFTNVGDPSKELVGNNKALSVGATGSAFTLEGNNRLKHANKRFVIYDNGWKLDDKNTALTFTKWTHVKIAGGIQFTVNPTSVSFAEFTDGTAENPVPGPKSVKITMKRNQAQEYYENQNNTTQVITVTNATGSTELPTISSVSAAWESSKNAISSADCQIYGADAVTKRQLMEIKSCTPNTSNTE